MIAVGAALGLVGPFGTYEIPAIVRLAYWMGCTLIGYAVYRPVQTVAGWLAAETRITLWMALLITAGLAALPLTVLIAFIQSGMQFGIVFWAANFSLLYAQVFAIGVAIQYLMRALFADAPAEVSGIEPNNRPLIPLDVRELPKQAPPDARFFERLPPELGHHLVCLEMQDHYVHAHTLAGSAMILMRLRDAIAELDGVEGAQVHRSWWVARDQVRAIRRDGRAIRLELANGLLAPVARNREGGLKQDGWF